MERVALAAVAAVVLAGCFGFGSQALSESEARDVTREALADFARDFASEDGGDLRMVRGEFGSGATGQAIGGNIEFEMEWGAQGHQRVSLHVSGSGATYDLAVHCGPDRTIVTYAEQRLERRPTEGSCLGSIQGDDDPLSVEDLSDEEIQDVDPHRDGSVTARLARDGGNVTVQVDPQGRLTRVDFGGDQSGFLRIEYGARQTIQMPTATSRLPALVHGAGSFTGERYEWRAVSGSETVPFNEVAVRVRDAQNTTVASFTLQPGTQTQGSFTLDFTDDGDGRFGMGDSFAVRGDAWTQADQFSVVVWDTWADAEVGEVPTPGLPLLVVLGAVVGAAAFVARR